jgi:dihydrofolate reductase
MSGASMSRSAPLFRRHTQEGDQHREESAMATVGTQASMSLDGFIADTSDGVDQLFGWYFAGDVETPTANPEMTFRTPQASAEYLRDFERVGALVVGRRQFDVAGGWSGRHPMDVPVYVVTHEPPADWAYPDAPFTFVTEGGAPSAIEQAKAVAGDKIVGVGPGDVAGQALEAGLVDEVRIDLVPVLLGDGIRMFGQLGLAPVQFGTPLVIEGTGVTHLIYRRP